MPNDNTISTVALNDGAVTIKWTDGDGQQPVGQVPARQLRLRRVRGGVDEPQAAGPRHGVGQYPGGGLSHGRQVRRAVPVERRPLHGHLPIRHAAVSRRPAVGVRLGCRTSPSRAARPRRVAPRRSPGIPSVSSGDIEDMETRLFRTAHTSVPTSEPGWEFERLCLIQ